MKIFYIDIEEFKKAHNKDFLRPYADREFKSEKRFYEYTIGRYLVKSKAKEYFGIKDTGIIQNENGKPVFKNVNLCFNISHSNNIVIACFDRFPCGIDIEYMRPRDIKKFEKHYNRKFADLEDFYKFWTIKEAEYKAGYSAKNPHSYKFGDYYVTVISR